MLHSTALTGLRFGNYAKAPAGGSSDGKRTPVDAVFIHDFRLRFLEVDRVACEWLGYTREELLRKKVLDIHPPGDSALVSRRLKELRRHGRTVFESAHVRRDGKVIPVEISSRVIEYAGGTGVLKIVRKIAECRRAEAEEALLEGHLRQAQEMEDILQLAGEFAHDFNNLMFVINGRTELMLGRLAPNDPKRKELELIHKSGKRAAVLAGRLLALSRRQRSNPPRHHGTPGKR